MSAQEVKPVAETVPAVETPVVVTPSEPVVSAETAESAAPAPVSETVPEPATETLATEEPVATSATEEVVTPAVEAVAPITQGFCRFKTDRAIIPLLKRKYFFLGGTDPVPKDELKDVLASKHTATARPAVAWAAVTGEGLLFTSQSKDDIHIEHAICLANATITAVKDKDFTINVTSEKTYHFTSDSKATRDAWLAGLTDAKKVADSRKEEIEQSETYINALKTDEVKAAPAEEAEAAAVADPALTSEGEAAVADKPASPRKRLSVFGAFGRRSASGARPDPVTTDPVVTEETPSAPVETADVAPAVEESAAPAATSGDEAKAEKRRTIFGMFGRDKHDKPVTTEVKQTVEAAATKVEETAEKAADKVEEAVSPTDKKKNPGFFGILRSRPSQAKVETVKSDEAALPEPGNENAAVEPPVAKPSPWKRMSILRPKKATAVAATELPVAEATEAPAEAAEAVPEVAVTETADAPAPLEPVSDEPPVVQDVPVSAPLDISLDKNTTVTA